MVFYLKSADSPRIYTLFAAAGYDSLKLGARDTYSISHHDKDTVEPRMTYA